MSLDKIVILVVFTIVALAAVPSLQRHRQQERLTDGVSALSRYALEMERFHLQNGHYGETDCGVSPPANTAFLSFSCQVDGDSYVATVRGIGALEGYEYALDDSMQPRKTVRFAGARVHRNCWLKTAGSCYS